MTIESCGAGWGLDAYRLVNVLIGKPCKGYYLRWWYNGWHYWFFLPGETIMVTEGEEYRTISTRTIRMSTGQVIYTQIQAIKTILHTREVYLLTVDGWANVRIEPGSMKIYDNKINGYEAEITAIIGSKAISYLTGYSPVAEIPVVDPVPDPDACGITIGTQVWACKNVASTFPNSKVYANNEANRAIYGGLYTWYQITTVGFAPPGWHVPTRAEWYTLIAFIGDITNGGGRLKEAGTDHWSDPNTGGVDTYGFKALGSGWANAVDEYYGIKSYTDFWTVDDINSWGAGAIQIGYNSAAIGAFTLPKANWFSVRLIKDVVASPILTDIDGNIYTSVIIGAQEWIVENYRPTKYANGDPITVITDAGDWVADVIGAMCYYDNDEATYKAIYGAIYNWYAVSNVSGFAYLERGGVQEAGWRVPTHIDFQTLSDEINVVEALSGGPLKEAGTTHWNSPNTGATNVTGFTLLPGGVRRDTDGAFLNIGDGSMLLGSDEGVDPAKVASRYFLYNFAGFYSADRAKGLGQYIRLVRDV
ncbi:MAG TPA: FISUMP domain-containing protein [Bacteroidales bacterium]|nr:FISUMP domain-containing protein [Bacteroidales bacterium]